MANSLFNKKLIKSCSWCRFGKKSDYTEEIFCLKHGVTNKRDYCRNYKYDPLKRKPDTANPLGNYKAEDFEI